MERFRETDESELVTLAKAGGDRGRAAYSELVRRHQAWLVRLVVQLTRVPQAVAEDVAQDAFVRTFVALDRLPQDVNFRAWVRVTAMRLAYNTRRNTATRTRLNQQVEQEELAPGGEALAARDALEAVLGELTYSEREALVLRYVEELPTEEIAAALNIGVSAAKMRIKRAREAFMEKYESLTGPAQ